MFVGLSVSAFVNMFVASFGGRISWKRLEIDGQLQWIINMKWHMATWMVTRLMTSRDLERSRSWPQYFWGLITRKWLEIETRLQWSTYRKWPMANRLVTWPMTSRDLERSKSYYGIHCVVLGQGWQWVKSVDEAKSSWR